jgi:hypothetical protein
MPEDTEVLHWVEWTNRTYRIGKLLMMPYIGPSLVQELVASPIKN